MSAARTCYGMSLRRKSPLIFFAENHDGTLALQNTARCFVPELDLADGFSFITKVDILTEFGGFDGFRYFGLELVPVCKKDFYLVDADLLVFHFKPDHGVKLGGIYIDL